MALSEHPGHHHALLQGMQRCPEHTGSHRALLSTLGTTMPPLHHLPTYTPWTVHKPTGPVTVHSTLLLYYQQAARRPFSTLDPLAWRRG